eukprot:395169-Lingulodinium_polyedra.AAC.1
MQETCFNDGPQQSLKHEFDSFVHEVYEARWGSIFTALEALLPLAGLLRNGWSLERFLGKAGEEKPREDGKSLDIRLADNAIHSE